MVKRYIVTEDRVQVMLDLINQDPRAVIGMIGQLRKHIEGLRVFEMADDVIKVDRFDKIMDVVAAAKGFKDKHLNDAHREVYTAECRAIIDTIEALEVSNG